ncbi:hypothetical protein SCANM63S_03207 [Streptomyces canarius]
MTTTSGLRTSKRMSWAWNRCTESWCRATGKRKNVLVVPYSGVLCGRLSVMMYEPPRQAMEPP